MIYRCIRPNWSVEEDPTLKRVVEGELTEDQILALNEKFYNIYYLPNHPALYEGGNVSGFQIDMFNYLFVDMDLKEGKYESKDAFIAKVAEFEHIPSKIIDSGNGVHVYWRVTDLDAQSYLRLQRRLLRYFNTDEAVGQIYQLMRVAETVNTKKKDDFKLCTTLFEDSSLVYTSEQLDSALPSITLNDENYCKQHFDKTYNIADKLLQVDDTIPVKFARLIESNAEVRDIWLGKSDDRSKDDFRLGHIMFAAAFTKEEATSVLVNSGKALQRAPIHRINYATNIIDKIWTFEIQEDKLLLDLSLSVKQILSNEGSHIKGTRFPCWSYLDNTEHGFRLGQVIGLVAGSGVGKTSVALNMFLGFVKNNPEYDHFFIPLEQPANEIADRWKTLCNGDEKLYEKVHIISNYDSQGQFRHLSFTEIKDYILKFQNLTSRKVGCVVIDHIGALKKKGKDGENQDLMEICHSMKAFAVQTNTMLVMQSQAPRQKAGIGDLELDKDSAYGTLYFEAYCDYLVTVWQPLKRVYADGAPTITAFKFCKIRHKKQHADVIREDVCYKLMFDTRTEHLRTLSPEEETSFDFFLKQATNKRKQDRKTDLVTYVSARI